MLHNFINWPESGPRRMQRASLRIKRGWGYGKGESFPSGKFEGHATWPGNPVGQSEGEAAMLELIRTNDAVLLSFAESLMKDAGIACFVADESMSVLEGSLGLLPRRFMVEEARAAEARLIFVEAGLEEELRS